ncbi:MAG: hypothetical protein ACTSRU_05345 [Candidatus Hodarchaeales archaeon]
MPFAFFSVFLPEELSLVMAITVIQYFFSLLTVFLFYRLFYRNFELSSSKALFLAFLYELVFLGPFLLLATAEILFIFYQSLSWMLFTKKRYFLSALAAAMTFALRFNGAFFIIGMFIIYYRRWSEQRELPVAKAFQASIALILMFMIGFSSFIWNFLLQGDFWLPLTSELSAYQRWEGYASIGVISLPFLWWINYLNWTFLSNSFLEVALLSLAVFIFVMSTISLVRLYKKSVDEKEHRVYGELFFLFSSGFIGANMVVSGRNFARFMTGVFPVIPCLPLWMKDRDFSKTRLTLLLMTGFLVFLVINLFFWLAVEPFPAF